MDTPQQPTSETVLRMTGGTKALVWLTLGAAGAGLGFALPWLLQRIATWPIPYIDALKFLGSFDAPLMVIGRPAVLALIGLVIAFFITYEAAELTISDTQIRIREGDDARIVTRAQVGGVYRKGGKLRIESVEGRILFNDDVEGGGVAIERAFTKHGYPWEGTA
ncbi:hypothetical protein [Leucobacter sp. G161]|uniref:YqeB family protein n=1 Tax=Leucobacter sp. G161 TaxID=663704 RepID=UPI00073BF571|nr:hypothetical protein [Leucobacter sp. G161]KUF05917.1 hypothetical protein AUL38_03620 [Leucobacter sp. G161]